MLDLKSVDAGYGSFQALFGVSLEVKAGEAVSVIGPNGAGKTTCFNMLNGQLRPDKGEVLLGGRPITGMKPRAVWRMGVGRTFGAAFARAHEAANIAAPGTGKAFLSVRESDKERLVPIARDLIARGFGLVATSGTCTFLLEHGIVCERINKVLEGRPHVVDLIKNREIAFIVNTTEGKQAIADSFSIRRQALQQRVTYSTTISGARALLHSLDFRDSGGVHSLQELHRELIA
jgi:carbamoyl-phosphate synthase large subunit